MASGRTVNYQIPYPLSTDPVAVSGDMQDLATTVDAVIREQIGNTDFQNVLYVAKTGSDDNDGTTPGNALLTIKRAAELATPLTTIKVSSGDYTENNPISLDVRVAVVGDSLRTVNVRPANPTQDIFWVRNACYLQNMTFRDHVAPAAAVAFPPDGSAGNIITSPYVQDCSSITTTGTGMYVDGSVVGGTRSMVLDAYTQFNSGGVGIHIDNEGYAQLVSIFTICTQDGVLCTNGGFCSVTNSNASFGTYGLRADGLGPIKSTPITVGETPVGTVIRISGLGGSLPVVNSVISFAGVNRVVLRERQNNIIKLTMEEPHGMSAGDSIEVTGLPGDFSGIFDVIASDALTVSFESTGFNVPSTSTTGWASIFYTIDNFDEVSPDVYDITVLERVVNPILAGTTAKIRFRSFISTSGHTFEYVGAGNTLAEALPELGGIPIQENEVVESKGGKVFYTSTDQRGDFRIGNGLLINRADGTITGRTFDRSLFAVLTPYILAIEG